MTPRPPKGGEKKGKSPYFKRFEVGENIIPFGMIQPGFCMIFEIKALRIFSDWLGPIFCHFES